MFNGKRIKELEKEILNLRGKLLDLATEVEIRTNIYFGKHTNIYGYLVKEKRVYISTVLENLLKKLGYEITHEYEPEKERYSLKKVNVREKVKK